MILFNRLLFKLLLILWFLLTVTSDKPSLVATDLDYQILRLERRIAGLDRHISALQTHLKLGHRTQHGNNIRCPRYEMLEDRLFDLRSQKKYLKNSIEILTISQKED